MVLKKGRVMEQGGHLELLRRKGLYYRLWQQQGLDREEPEAVAVGA